MSLGTMNKFERENPRETDFERVLMMAKKARHDPATSRLTMYLKFHEAWMYDAITNEEYKKLLQALYGHDVEVLIVKETGL